MVKKVASNLYIMKDKKIEKLKSYTSRADMAVDIRDYLEMMDKINQIIEYINKEKTNQS